MITRSRSWRWPSVQRATRRWHSSDVLSASLKSTVQHYISRSNDPYLNLSIEHYLLQKSATDSVILFLYVNRPSVIIGRNQNPWFEVNLPLLSSGNTIDLVRRRSGGGTVFHDYGNVNWSVISPPATFTRDKHAEMVVRALRACGLDRARVNERHDIVMDQGSKDGGPDTKDLHSTVYREDGNVRSLKVSGSAYKLTKHRALHHGTCLLSSPNLTDIGRYLRSPLRPYIEAKGVESVSSPVANLGLENDEFLSAVREQFQSLYAGVSKPVVLDSTCAENIDVQQGLAELESSQWTYLQTPQFVLTTGPEHGETQIELIVRYGVITEAKARPSINSAWRTSTALEGTVFHEVTDWQQTLKHAGWSSEAGALVFTKVGAWLTQHLP